MARVKFDINKTPHERIPKKTSIGRRPKMSSMNKHKKRSFKRYNSQGKWYTNFGGYCYGKNYWHNKTLLDRP